MRQFAVLVVGATLYVVSEWLLEKKRDFLVEIGSALKDDHVPMADALTAIYHHYRARVAGNRNDILNDLAALFASPDLQAHIEVEDILNDRWTVEPMVRIRIDLFLRVIGKLRCLNDSMAPHTVAQEQVEQAWTPLYTQAIRGWLKRIDKAVSFTKARRLRASPCQQAEGEC